MIWVPLCPARKRPSPTWQTMTPSTVWCEGRAGSSTLAASPMRRRSIRSSPPIFSAPTRYLGAARRQGAGPIVYASSNHVVGFYTRHDRLDADARARPNSLYEVSKAFGEDLASFFADKYGVESACLRIGTARPDPADPRQLSTWQSYEDLLRMIQACFSAPKLDCNDPLWRIRQRSPVVEQCTGAANVNYRPQDNAERFAAKLVPDGDKRDFEAPAVEISGRPVRRTGFRAAPRQEEAGLSACARPLRRQVSAALLSGHRFRPCASA